MAVLFAPGNGGNRERQGHVRRVAESARVRRTADGLPRVRREPGQSQRSGPCRRCEACVQALEELGYPATRTLYFGESLGTGVVSALQAERPPAGVILRSPFTNLADVGAHHYRGFRCAR